MQTYNPSSMLHAMSHGMTFIEILLILMLLAILASIMVPIYLNRQASPSILEERRNITTIENAMKFYKLDNGFYPTNKQGISALQVKPSSEPIPKHWTQYLTIVPMDKWGNPYHYANPGRHGEIEVYSVSP